MLEDELLKLRFKAGRPGALERIYEKYRDFLLTLAMQLLNDSGAAEDVVQDVFVSFAQRGEGFGLRGSLRSYLATCVVNRVRDLMRASKRRGPVLSLEADPPLESDWSRPDGRLVGPEEAWKLGDDWQALLVSSV
jgi:RNA polymerase sigma factor (sigma-70 family)